MTMDMFAFLEDAGRKLDVASRVLPSEWYTGYVLGEAGFSCPSTASLSYQEGWEVGNAYSTKGIQL